jgi:chromate transport protein ChrA
MIEQEPLVPHRWDIETDVVVARLGTAGFSGTQGLIPFGRSPLVNQAKEERSYEEYMAR